MSNFPFSFRLICGPDVFLEQSVLQFPTVLWCDVFMTTDLVLQEMPKNRACIHGE